MEIKLNGMKTYISAMGLIMYAVGGWVAGKLDFSESIPLVFAGLATMGLRHRVEILKKYFEQFMQKKEPE